MADLYVRGEVVMSSQKEQLRAFHKAGILSDEEYLAALNGEGEEQLIVAADGSGDLSDLEEALELAPAGRRSRSKRVSIAAARRSRRI